MLEVYGKGDGDDLHPMTASEDSSMVFNYFFLNLGEWFKISAIGL